MRRYLLSICALAGLVLAIAFIIRDSIPDEKAAHSSSAVRSPFAASVAGAGIIEASTENISVGTPVSGIVTEIYVKPGSEVKAGDPLFKIDDRDLQGELLTATAKINEAQADLAKAKNLLDIAEQTYSRNTGAVSKQDLDNRRYDEQIAEAAVNAAQAEVGRLNIEIDRRTIRALVAGRVLQIKTRLGQFAQAGVATDPPLMLLGNETKLHVRVNIDENDAGKVAPDAPAVGFARGSPDVKIPLKFDYIEPYVLPKLSLTGVSTERVDTRVLQVVYSFAPDNLPLYAGEQMDVFIQSEPQKKS